MCAVAVAVTHLALEVPLHEADVAEAQRQRQMRRAAVDLKQTLVQQPEV